MPPHSMRQHTICHHYFSRLTFILLLFPPFLLHLYITLFRFYLLLSTYFTPGISCTVYYTPCTVFSQLHSAIPTDFFSRFTPSLYSLTNFFMTSFACFLQVIRFR